MEADPAHIAAAVTLPSSSGLVSLAAAWDGSLLLRHTRAGGVVLAQVHARVWACTCVGARTHVREGGLGDRGYAGEGAAWGRFAILVRAWAWAWVWVLVRCGWRQPAIPHVLTHAPTPPPGLQVNGSRAAALDSTFRLAMGSDGAGGDSASCPPSLLATAHGEGSGQEGVARQVRVRMHVLN